MYEVAHVGRLLKSRGYALFFIAYVVDNQGEL